MPELSPYTNEAIDAAWQDALDTNAAFDRYKSAEIRLQKAREVANFAINGITIEDEVFTTLEGQLADARADFETHIHTPAPLMTAPDSPFRSSDTQIDGSAVVRAAQKKHNPGAKEQLTIEQVIDRTSPVCYFDELCNFAELQEYNRGMGTRVWGVLAREGKKVEIDSFLDYVSPTDTSAEDFGELRTIYGTEPGKGQVYALDKVGMLYHAAKWVNNHPDIRNFGVTAISFLADYCNHAFPDLDEPLPVTHPPKPSYNAEAESAKLRELDPKELLLDKVNLKDEGEVWVVTARSLKRHALSLGVEPQRTPRYPRLLQGIKSHMAHNEPSRSRVPHRLNDWLVYIGREYALSTNRIRANWGIEPEAFKDIINRLEASPEERQHIEAYTGLTRDVLKQYLEALETVLPDLSKED